MIKTAIFWDNDGVLVDTEKYYFESTQKVLSEANFNLTRELYIELLLVQSRGAWHLLDPEKYPPEEIAKLRAKRDLLYKQYIQTREILIPGVKDIISELSKIYRMAIVTSSKTEHFKAIHSKTGLLQFFEFTLTAEDYSHYKPDPEPYRKAIEKMGISPNQGFAVEDSRRGLLSAKGAGLNCFILKNELTSTSDFSEADKVFSNHIELFNYIKTL